MIKSIKILGLDYKIELYGDLHGISNVGQVYNPQALIQLHKDTNSSEHMKSVLLHEIIEALNYRLELRLDHNVITSLEAGFFQVLQDNKKFVKLFLEK